MKNLIIVLCVLIISSIQLLSQQVEDVMINRFWSFYSDNFLNAVSSGKGNTGTAGLGDMSSIILNPASLNIPGKYSASVQYTYKTNQPWLEFLGLDDLYLRQNMFSGSAGFGYRINKNFQTGFLYSNPHSLTLNIGTIIITNEFGEEIGRYDGNEKYVLHSFSVPLVYNIKWFRAGVILNYSLHRRYMSMGDSDYTGKFDRFNIQAGIIVNPIKELSIGASFTPGDSGAVENSYPSIASEETTQAEIPFRISAGAEYTVKGNIVKLAADYIYTNLSSREGLKDRHEIHFGFEYFVNKNWTVRSGFFNITDPRELPGNYGNPQDNYDQIFLTIGATYKIKEFEGSIGIMDSHISPGVLKNTFINGGVTFNFK